MNASEVIAISSIVIACGALIATVWQVILTRRHNVLSLRPHLDIGFGKKNGEPIMLRIYNAGLGPAFITAIKVKLNGIDFDIDSSNKLDDLVYLLSGDVKNKYDTHGLFECAPIKAGDCHVLFSIMPQNDNDDWTLIKNNSKSLSIMINYKCAYEKKYTARMNIEDLIGSK